MGDNSANETCKNGVEDWNLVKTTFFNHISGSQQTLKVKKCFGFFKTKQEITLVFLIKRAKRPIH